MSEYGLNGAFFVVPAVFFKSGLQIADKAVDLGSLVFKQLFIFVVAVPAVHIHDPHIGYGLIFFGSGLISEVNASLLGAQPEPGNAAFRSLIEILVKDSAAVILQPLFGGICILAITQI